MKDIKDTKNNFKRLSVNLTEDEHYEIKNTATRLKITITQLINDALSYYAKYLEKTNYKNYDIHITNTEKG